MGRATPSCRAASPFYPPASPSWGRFFTQEHCLSILSGRVTRNERRTSLLMSTGRSYEADRNPFVDRRSDDGMPAVMFCLTESWPLWRPARRIAVITAFALTAECPVTMAGRSQAGQLA